MARYYISPGPISPLGRILASVFAVLAVVGALIFGFFVLVAALVIGVLAWAGFTIRSWWRRRKGIENGIESPPARPSVHSEVIEAEYTVISRRRE